MNSFNKNNVKDIYTLSPMQEGMLFHSIEGETTNTYLIQLVVPIYGELDEKILVESFSRIIDRYDVFRTTFIHEKLNKPLQVVLENRRLDVNKREFQCTEEEDKLVFIQDYLEEDRKRSFDLVSDALIRLGILKINNHENIVIITFHHILMDGWCSDIILNDLLKIYSSLKNNEDVSLPPTKQFAEYIKWFERQDQETAGQYWGEYLKNYEETSSISCYKKKDDHIGDNFNEFVINLDEDVACKLKDISRRNQVTLNTALNTIWAILLQKYTDSTDVVFGSVVAGRPIEIDQVDTMVGLFINTLPVRVKYENQSTFSELMINVQEEALNSKQYEYYSLSKIQNKSIGQGLFDHIVVFDNSPTDKKWVELAQQKGLNIGEVKVLEHTNYNLSVTFTQKNNLEVKFIYNASVFSEEEIKHIAQHLEIILTAVANNPDLIIDDIPVISEEEKVFLNKLNNTSIEYPKDKTAADLFEEQVAKTPDNCALSLNNKELTYKELNKYGNYIAHKLQEDNVQPDNLIGLMAERSFEMIIGILGILKSNGAYLPLDPENPIERIKMIIEDSRTDTLLVQRSTVNKVKEVISTLKNKEDIKLIIIEDILEQKKPEHISNPIRNANSNNLIYVMYTSGSTGKPKGILTQHYNVIRMSKNTNYIDINPTDTLLQLSNFAFDGSTFDIFGALLNGAKLILIDKETLLDMTKLVEVIEKEGVSVFFVTTALFNALVDLNIESFLNIRKVLFGGERVSVPHVNKLLHYVGENKISHVYGPTESTVYATYYDVNYIDEFLATVPIGKPLANTKVYVLSKKNQIQPIGVTGELCISGDGLARGYLNNKELTENKFIDNPFEENEILYKTGDLARVLPDGNIEFVGRIDHQVKLRGFRIELGEIECAILQHEDIKKVKVIDILDSLCTKKLCAYYVADKKFNNAELRSFLAKSLPQYMIPSYFHYMTDLPVNPNGKIEVRLLPKPKLNESSDSKYVEPRNEIEKILADIWQDILGISKVSIMDNYFELGGDSIKSIQISLRLREKGLMMKVKDLFQNPTISEFSNCIRNVEIKEEIAATKFEKELLSEADFMDLESELEGILDK